MTSSSLSTPKSGVGLRSLCVFGGRLARLGTRPALEPPDDGGPTRFPTLAEPDPDPGPRAWPLAPQLTPLSSSSAAFALPLPLSFDFVVPPAPAARPERVFPPPENAGVDGPDGEAPLFWALAVATASSDSLYGWTRKPKKSWFGGRESAAGTLALESRVSLVTMRFLL